MIQPKLACLLALTILAPIGFTNSSALAGKDDRTRPADKEAVAMDYGPAIANTFEAPNGNLTVKGILIKLDKEHDANVLFDTELCRFSCGWVGPKLHLASRVFSSDNDFHCTIENGVDFATGMTPGWANGDKYDDPRNPKDGPLPHEWAHYKGMYLHGNQVVLSYSVGKTDVLELPGVRDMAFFSKIVPQFTRDIRVGAHKQPMTMLVFEADAGDLPEGKTELAFDHRNVLSNGKHGEAGQPLIFQLKGKDFELASYVGAPDGAEPVIHGRRLYLKVPPASTPVVFRVTIEHHPDELLPSPVGEVNVGNPIDPEPLTHGGPARWNQTVTTTSELAKDEKSPYVIDTLQAPDKNPWNSWIRFTGIDFFPDGHRAALCTWSGDVWIVSGIDHDLKQLTWKRFATGLNNPMGVKIVDGTVYTIDRSQITKLVDLDGDGEADFYQNL